VAAEVAAVAAPDAEAAAVSVVADTAAADATNQEQWRDGRPRPSGRAQLGSFSEAATEIAAFFFSRLT
jgi:hypothetical protein